MTMSAPGALNFATPPSYVLGILSTTQQPQGVSMPFTKTTVDSDLSNLASDMKATLFARVPAACDFANNLVKLPLAGRSWYYVRRKGLQHGIRIGHWSLPCRDGKAARRAARLARIVLALMYLGAPGAVAIKMAHMHPANLSLVEACNRFVRSLSGLGRGIGVRNKPKPKATRGPRRIPVPKPKPLYLTAGQKFELAIQERLAARKAAITQLT